MAKWILAAGAAALALTTPALAGPDKGHGGGGTGAAKADHGGGGPKAGHDGGPKAHGGGHQAGPRMSQDRGQGSAKPRRQAQHVERGHKADHQVARIEQRGHKPAKAEHRGNDHRIADGKHDRDVRIVRDDRREDRRGVGARNDVRFADSDFGRRLSGFTDNCPPGLARKDNGCLPPGQAKKLVGVALPAALGASLLDGPYRQWYRDNDQYYYRDDGDYIYRVNRNGGLVDALFPFEDRDYSYYPVGMTYPTAYDYYNVPYQYQSFYPDGGDFDYRYGDGAIYQVNPANNSISSIVALLAGDLAVGQPLPGDYGVYNVPLAYRDRYYDTPDALYRYNDGYIYQADPKTQLITAVIQALV
jgi:hypothetical protein